MIPVVDDPAGMTDGRLRVGRNFGMLGPMICFDRSSRTNEPRPSPISAFALSVTLTPRNWALPDASALTDRTVTLPTPGILIFLPTAPLMAAGFGAAEGVAVAGGADCGAAVGVAVGAAATSVVVDVTRRAPMTTRTARETTIRPAPMMPARVTTGPRPTGAVLGAAVKGAVQAVTARCER